jgi:hypothetical protein
MALPARWSALFLFALAASAFAEPAGSTAEIDRLREELGVSRINAPSIEQVFDDLAVLEPIPFDKLWHPLPDHLPQDRARMALLAGNLIADGFLVVKAERASKIEPLGRGLVRIAKGLGIGERLTKRGRHLMEMADHEHWVDIHHELIKTQVEAEAALVALKDDDLVYLVAMGGWLRGLEITSYTVAETYTPERATHLFQPELADNFLDRLRAFHPRLRNSAVVQALEKDLRGISDLVPDKGHERPYTLAEVKRIHDLTREADKIAGAGE